MRRKAFGHILRWCAGGLLYGLLEVLWRGHTHWTMVLLAAALCVPLDMANETVLSWETPLALQAVMGGTVITAAEFAAGCVLNLGLHWNIWDYSREWGNILGQVCPKYWALWCLLAGPVIAAFDWIAYLLDGGPRPEYK